ncbi:MAG: hypothetical protein RL757_156 [Bacteroidota bacterium]|jgi:hypothetical protein
MKKNIVLLLAFCLLQWSHTRAQTILQPCKEGAALITAIRTTYTPNQVLGYDTGRDSMYGRLDVVNGTLECIYTGYQIAMPASVVLTPRPTCNAGGINAEHTFPQSMGAATGPPESDLHHLHPCKSNVNSARGNLPYGNIPTNSITHWYIGTSNLTTAPTSGIPTYSKLGNGEFEPRDIKKGNIARGMFYFMTIYEAQVLAAAGGAAFWDGMKNDLLAWHYADPVDASERARSQRIKTWQGNENPFILDSTLARRAFFLPSASYATGSSSCFLPVELVSFQGKINEKYADLTWETASELHNKGFEIEESHDAKNWLTLAFVPAKGNTTAQNVHHNYQFSTRLDEQNAETTHYFRLRQIDVDGTTHLSNVVSLVEEQKGQAVQIYPNPTHSNLKIEWAQNTTASAEITVFDMLGKAWIQSTTENNQQNIDVLELPNGVYWLQIQQNGKIERVKFLKQ